MKKPVILHVIDSLVRGGAETLLVGVVNSMNHYTHVIAVLNGVNEFDMVNAKVINLSYSKKVDMAQSILKLRRIIRTYEIKLIHSHLLTATFLARMAKPSGVKLIFSVHNLLSQSAFKKSRISWILERLTYRKSHEAIFVTNEVKMDYRQSIGLKGMSHVLYNYVEEDFFSGVVDNFRQTAKGDTIRLVAVGSLKSQKNYKFLIDCLSTCGLNFKLDIYGDGPLKAELSNQIQECNLSNKVTLMGKDYSISGVLNKYDIYVLCSSYEGFGIAPVEAMAMGLPVMLSNIPVLKEVARDSAVFFIPNDESDFIQKLSSLATSDDMRQELSVKGRQRADEISRKERYISKLLGIYKPYVGN